MEWKMIFWPGEEAVLFWLMFAGVSLGFMVLVRVAMIIARPDPEFASLFTRTGFGLALMGLIEAGLMWVGLKTLNTAFWPVSALVAYTHVFVSILGTMGICSLIPGFMRPPRWIQRLMRLSANK